MKLPKQLRHYCVFMLLLGFVYFIDWITSAEVSVGPLYLFVVAYAAWNLGKFGGGLAAFTCVIIWMLVDIKDGYRYSHTWIIWQNGAMRLITYLAETYCIALYRATLDAHRKRLAVMEHVLAVCPGCGRIGAHEDGWLHVAELSKTRDRYKFCPVCKPTPPSDAPENSARAKHA